MNLVNAIIQVLTEADGPLHVRDITERILGQGLWQTRGKTPDATVGARLYTDIKEKGEASLFEQTGAAAFSLKKKDSKENNEIAPTQGGDSQDASVRARNSFTDCAVLVLV